MVSSLLRSLPVRGTRSLFATGDLGRHVARTSPMLGTGMSAASSAAVAELSAFGAGVGGRLNLRVEEV